LNADWSLRQLVDEVGARGTQAAVVSVGREAVDTLTCAALADAVKGLAAGLTADGLKAEEPIALFAPNSADWVVIALAVMAAGGVIVPIDDLYRAKDAAPLLQKTRPKRLFATRTHLDVLGISDDAAPSAVWLLDGSEADADRPNWRSLLARSACPLPDLEPDRPAAWFATSGTTGQPKVFTLPHRNLAATVAALAAERIVRPGDRALLPLPLHHAYPTIVGMLTSLTTGTAIVLPEGVSGPQILRALEAGEATLIIGVPRLYEALLLGIRDRVAAAGHLGRWAFDRLLAAAVVVRKRTGLRLGRFLFAPIHKRLAPRLRLLVSGGAHLPAPLHWRLEAMGWLVLSGYGLAETSSVITCNRPRRCRPGSAGQPLGDGEVRIDKPDEKGVGEIVLRGSAVTPGYRDSPEANRASFTEDGWFRSGDLGSLDDDGFLWVIGRKEEMIVLAGGKKVNPEDLEKVYAESPFVEEIAVLERDGSLVGLVRPDVAAIKSRGLLGIRQALRVSLGEIARELPTYQRLAGIVTTGETLPRTRLGKYRRFKLDEIYKRAIAKEEAPQKAELSDEDRRLLRDPLAQTVWRLLEERFPDRPFGMESSTSLDLGLDSFGWMNLTLEIEEHIGVILSGDDIADVDTVRELIERVRRAGHEGAAPPRRKRIEAILADRERWLRPLPLWLRLAGAAVAALNRLLIRGVFGLTVRGLEKLPREGALLIAPNHASDLDALVLAAALPARLLRRTYWSGEVSRLFANAISRLFCRMMRVFPVDERAPRTAIDSAVDVLKRGHVQVWFPEAWRSPDGSVQEFLPGVGALLSRCEASTVPAYIAGTFAAMPRGRRLPRLRPLAIVFGQPATVPELRAEGQGESVEQRIADGLRQRVIALERDVREGGG